MKLLALTFCSLLALSSLAFAEGQTDTECPSMAESNQRENTKDVKKLKEEVGPQTKGSEAVSG